MIKDILFKSKVEMTMLLNSRVFQLKKLGFVKDSNISSFTKNIAIFSGVFINIISGVLNSVVCIGGYSSLLCVFSSIGYWFSSPNMVQR